MLAGDTSAGARQLSDTRGPYHASMLALVVQHLKGPVPAPEVDLAMPLALHTIAGCELVFTLSFRYTGHRMPEACADEGQRSGLDLHMLCTRRCWICVLDHYAVRWVVTADAGKPWHMQPECQGQRVHAALGLASCKLRLSSDTCAELPKRVHESVSHAGL